MPKNPKKERAKKNKSASDSGIFVEASEDEHLPDEDIFGGMDGLPDDDFAYFAYRKVAGTQKLDFLDEYPGGCSVTDLKRDHGGGSYVIFCRDDRGIKRKTIVTIAGEPRKLNSERSEHEVSRNVETVTEKPRESLAETIALMDSLMSILDKKNNSGNSGLDMTKQITEMMSANMASQMSNMTMIQEAMRGNMALMKEVSENKSGSGWMDVLNNFSGTFGQVLEKIMAAKSDPRQTVPINSATPTNNNGAQKTPDPAIKETETMNENIKLIVASLKKGMDTNDQDYEFYIDLLEKWDRSIIDQAVTIPVDTIIEGIKTTINVTNEEWLRNLIIKIKDANLEPARAESEPGTKPTS